jgi:hypothetical protein
MNDLGDDSTHASSVPAQFYKGPKIGTVSRLLDKVKYQDENVTRHETCLLYPIFAIERLYHSKQSSLFFFKFVFAFWL